MTPERRIEDDSAPRKRRGRQSFSRKLVIAFAAVAALTAALSAVLLMAVWNYQFDRYLRDDLQHIADGVSGIASQAYQTHGGWTLQTLALVPRFGSMRGIGIQILDESGNLIYDDTTSSSRQQSMQEGGEDFVIQPKGPVVTSNVKVSNAVVGTVRVWAYGPGAVLTERDAQFRSGSFSALTIAALVAIAFASIAGVWYSTRLVSPIEQITGTVRALRSGDRDARTRLSGEDEIAILGQAFDDMADAIEADRQLERRLTADVAHELRTPLQGIQATVEAMQDGVLPADEERLEVVRNETVRLARLTDGILELTRLERGSLPFKMERIDVAEPVRAAVEAIEALIESREIALSVDLEDRLYVKGDCDRIQQAAGNLLSNAARYTPPGGRVTVSVRRENAQAVIEVADTGVGIAESDMNKVFSRFWRADSARASTSGGIGIGLAVTKEIVERHGGMIGVESKEGSGTKFTVRIPLA